MSEEVTAPVEAEEAQGQANEAETTPAPQAGPAATNLQALLQSETAKREAEVRAAEQQRRAEGIEKLGELARTDPKKFFEVVGAKYPVPEKPKGSELDRLKAEIESLKEGWTQRQQQDQQLVRQAEMERVRREVHSFVDTNEDYPLTKAAGMSDAVYDTLVAYHQSNQPISEAEAAGKVEENLVGLVEKLLANEAIRSRFLGNNSQPNREPISLSNVTDSSSSRSYNPGHQEDDVVEAFASLLKFTS